MLEATTVRLPPDVMQEIDDIVAAGAREGLDKSAVLRRLIVKGLDAERRGK